MISNGKLSAGNRVLVPSMPLAALLVLLQSVATADDLIKAAVSAAPPSGDSTATGAEPVGSYPPNPASAQEPIPSRYLMGVQCSQADPLLQKHLKLNGKGLIVQDLIPDGPADRSGLTRGDLILRAGDRDLRTVQELMQVIQDSKGEPVDLTILRSGEPLTVSVVPELRAVAEKSSDGLGSERQFHPGIISSRNSGTEDAHQIVEQALKAAGMDSVWQLTPQQTLAPAVDISRLETLQEISSLREQIRLLTERVIALEKKRDSEAVPQNDSSRPGSSTIGNAGATDATAGKNE